MSCVKKDKNISMIRAICLVERTILRLNAMCRVCTFSLKQRGPFGLDPAGVDVKWS